MFWAEIRKISDFFYLKIFMFYFFFFFFFFVVKFSVYLNRRVFVMISGDNKSGYQSLVK